MVLVLEYIQACSPFSELNIANLDTYGRSNFRDSVLEKSKIAACFKPEISLLHNPEALSRIRAYNFFV